MVGGGGGGQKIWLNAHPPLNSIEISMSSLHESSKSVLSTEKVETTIFAHTQGQLTLSLGQIWPKFELIQASFNAYSYNQAGQYHLIGIMSEHISLNMQNTQLVKIT